jgi:hypothetical protein
LLPTAMLEAGPEVVGLPMRRGGGTLAVSLLTSSERGTAAGRAFVASAQSLMHTVVQRPAPA